MLRIGEWTVDPSANEIWREGQPRQRLRHKVMATLVLLAEQPGQVVSRETLVERIWDGNQFVAQKAINNAIWTLRQALGDDPEAPRYLETIAKKGYRLIAAVEVLAPPETEPTPSPIKARWLWSLAALPLLALGLLAGPWRSAEPPAPAPQSRLLTQLAGVEFVGQHSPDRRWLAFAWWQGQGDAELMLRASDHQGAGRSLSAGLGDVHALGWAEGGQALVFTALKGGQCTVYRTALQGGEPRPLAACSPLFTPALAVNDAGDLIAFTAPGDGSPGLFALRPDGSGLRRLTRTPDGAMPDHQPAFSPDGRRLAFARQSPAGREVYELDLQQPEAPPRALTQLRLSTLHGLAYAPDGQDLLLSTTEHDLRQLQRWSRRDGRLQPLGQEGSAPLREPNGRYVVALLRGNISLARWLPDTGAGLEALASALTSRRRPALSSQQGLAFVARAEGGQSQLWLAQPFNAPPQERLHLPGDLGRPAWSPDGQRLAFWARCGEAGRIALCVLDAAGGPPHAVWEGGVAGGTPAWVGDHQLAFTRPDPSDPRSWRAWRLDLRTTTLQPWPGSPALAVEARLAWSQGQLWGVAPSEAEILSWRPGDNATSHWPVPTGSRLMSWAPDPEHGLLLLSRGSREQLLALASPSATPRLHAEWPLGTLPEFGQLAVAPGLWVLERSSGAQGDLAEFSLASP